MFERTAQPRKCAANETVRMELIAHALANGMRRHIANNRSHHSPHLRAGVARTTSLPSHRSIYGVALQVVRWWANLDDSRPLDRVVTPGNVSMAYTFASTLLDLKVEVVRVRH